MYIRIYIHTHSYTSTSTGTHVYSSQTTEKSRRRSVVAHGLKDLGHDERWVGVAREKIIKTHTNNPGGKA